MEAQSKPVARKFLSRAVRLAASTEGGSVSHRLAQSLAVFAVVVSASLAPSAEARSMSPIVNLDYSPATWVPANPNNYTVSDRPDSYQVNMIVIHDIEGSSGTAIQLFQSQLRKAGINITLKSVDKNDFNNAKRVGKFDVILAN